MKATISISRSTLTAVRIAEKIVEQHLGTLEYLRLDNVNLFISKEGDERDVELCAVIVDHFDNNEAPVIFKFILKKEGKGYRHRWNTERVELFEAGEQIVFEVKNDRFEVTSGESQLAKLRGYLQTRPQE